MEEPEVDERVSQFCVFEAFQLRTVPAGPEFQTENVWDAGFDPPAAPLKEMVCGFRLIAGAARTRVTLTFCELLDALGSEMVIVSL